MKRRRFSFPQEHQEPFQEASQSSENYRAELFPQTLFDFWVRQKVQQTALTSAEIRPIHPPRQPPGTASRECIC
jgi:hypothetical protein